MATAYESARLNLQLFEMRREPVLREARAWFLAEFNPESIAELVAVISGERNASFRMVLGYWDMAASLVTTGAIDATAFRAAHSEVFGTCGNQCPWRGGANENTVNRAVNRAVVSSARPSYSAAATTAVGRAGAAAASS